jgi:hypothetical protein
MPEFLAQVNLAESKLDIERDDKHIRQTDFDFLMSQEAQEVVKGENIILLDYRTLQGVWRGI